MLAEAWCLMLMLDTAARAVRPSRLLPWVLVRRVRGDVPAPAEMTRVVRLVEVAARHHVHTMRCLARSLTLARMLASRGLKIDLRVGVRLDPEGSLRAHAWVEWQGQPINDAARVGDDYAAFELPEWENSHV